MINKVVWLVAHLYLCAAYITDVNEDFRPTKLHEGDRHSSHPPVLIECFSSNCKEGSRSRHVSEGLTKIREEFFSESDQRNEDGGKGSFVTTHAKDEQEMCDGKWGLQKNQLIMPNGDGVDSSVLSRGNKTYYEKMLMHLFSLAILLYSNKSYLEKMASQLPQEHYLCYKDLQQNMNRIYENNFTQMYEEFFHLEEKEKLIEQRGIEKYYYAFNRMVYTLQFFLYEILQKEDALHRSFESLPVEYGLQRNELVDTVTKSTPSHMDDIYFKTYKFFDSMCSCLDLSSSFNFTYVGKKMPKNLNEEGSFHRKIPLEMKKINEYITNTHNNIVEYIKDLSSYFKKFFDYAAGENLFCEPVLYCYSLFLDYYLSTMDQLMVYLNLHLKHPINKESQESLSHIYKEIKTHADNLGCTMRSFFFKKNIKSDPELSIISFFTDSNFRHRLVDKYNNEKYANFISLMLSILGYLRVLVASITSLVTLQTVYALLVDTENGDIKYVDAVKALSYLTKYISHSSSLFAAVRKEKN
ncbi:Uncharacterized protein PCOAH_00005410 [Plasmodium coatneyi]|uniref:Erythrocyte vesicle protein 1 n=1 Tax=Plasmodium coatneyi TaxID=208452 RepID=A0A1B1DTL7_9APIC|nr:Uncharacterized protein PCOAH_00005410 [Plasmodium coatneyi]ANQ06128.1 Uncharacterized protein PCOAH_00005410 [Plasmodium coatneyi]